MKKFAFLALAALLFAACTTEEYYTNVNTYTQTYTVKLKDWQEEFDQTGRYYYCPIEEPKLTNEIFQHGQKNAFLYYVPEGITNNVLSPLPFSDFVTIFDKNGDLINKWEEHITIEYEPGYITFIIKFDDHAPEDPFYKEYTFVVQFMW
jgi:hypothetical protein